jgi:excisionase family DNA binding protein
MKDSRANSDTRGGKRGCDVMAVKCSGIPDPDPSDSEQLLTIKQVAGLMQYSVQTIRNRLDSGSFLRPTHRDGRMIRWRRADLLEYLKRLRNK